MVDDEENIFIKHMLYLYLFIKKFLIQFFKLSFKMKILKDNLKNYN